MRATYDQILDNKYKYQGDPNKLNFGNYEEKEDHKNLTNSELLALQQGKLKGTLLTKLNRSGCSNR